MNKQSKTKTHKQYATLRVSLAYYIERRSSGYKYR